MHPLHGCCLISSIHRKVPASDRKSSVSPAVIIEKALCCHGVTACRLLLSFVVYLTALFVAKAIKWRVMEWPMKWEDFRRKRPGFIEAALRKLAW